MRDGSVRFGNKVVLEDVTFFVPRGEFMCLCGPHGADKSTLLKAILHLVKPDKGEILIGGLPRGQGASQTRVRSAA